MLPSVAASSPRVDKSVAIGTLQLTKRTGGDGSIEPMMMTRKRSSYPAR